MTLLVFDASAALSMLVASQSTPKAEALAETLEDHDLIAPDIFRWEVTNVLLALSRRSVLFDLEESLDIFSSIPVELDHPLLPEELDQVTALARQSELSLFDAAYLHLAIRSGASLASRDRKLIDAAALNRISCLDLGNPNLEA